LLYLHETNYRGRQSHQVFATDHIAIEGFITAQARIFTGCAKMNRAALLNCSPQLTLAGPLTFSPTWKNASND
jgi:hypothetical protein